jgi:hypothetical protein
VKCIGVWMGSGGRMSEYVSEIEKKLGLGNSERCFKVCVYIYVLQSLSPPGFKPFKFSSAV